MGPLPVTVPGCVDAWCELHARYGKLPLHEVLAPAIRYAREGFPVSELIAYYWGRNAPALAKFEGFKEQFLIEGQAPAKGDVFRNPNLATTLEKIGAGGRDAFYRGRSPSASNGISRAMVASSQGGSRRSYVEWVKPVSANYRGYDVFELPPPTQGIAALEMLGILEGYDLKAMGFGSADHVHAFVEAKKLAFEDRAHFYADPSFVADPVAGLLARTTRRETPELIRVGRAATIRHGQSRARTRRHGLPHDRRRRRQHGLADPVELPSAWAPG